MQITQKLRIPTIGIGAGSDCDGQVLVTSDLLGLSEKQPPFAKVYTNLRETITKAVQDYAVEVRDTEVSIMGNGEWGMGNGDGNGEWGMGMGNGEWGMVKQESRGRITTDH